jgi:hypothetical protein
VAKPTRVQLGQDPEAAVIHSFAAERMDPRQEALIREEVRRQIAEADQRRRDEEEARREAEELFLQEQARRRIMAEEARSYYQNSPDYFEYVNENGDTEWLTRKQILAREGYFVY